MVSRHGFPRVSPGRRFSCPLIIEFSKRLRSSFRIGELLAAIGANVSVTTILGRHLVKVGGSSR